MLTEATIKFITDESAQFIMIASRFSSTFSALAYFRRDFVPVRITIFLSFILTLFVFMYVNPTETTESLSTATAFTNLVIQVFLGFITAFIINIFIEVFLALGQIISVQSGLGFVNLYVPKVGSITPLSQFFFLASATIFFELNGHLVLVKLLVDSFRNHLLHVAELDMNFMKELMLFTKVIFTGSFMLSLAIVISLLVVNITLAVMTKFSPQLNIFSIGITISLITSFFVLYLCFDAMMENGGVLFNDVFVFLKHSIGGLIKS